MPADLKNRASGQQDADLVGQYLRDVGGTPLLTASEEVDLAKRIEAGVYAAHLLRTGATRGDARLLRRVVADGERAKDHMIRANLRLVVSVAKKHSFRGLPFLDVVQEGNLGLIRAVEKFDYAKGYKFSTYAMWWIRQAIERGLAEQTRTVRLPVHVVEEVNKLKKIGQKLSAQFGREATVEEIAAEAKCSVGRVQDLRDAARTCVSLETPVGDEGDSVLGDLIQDTDGVSAPDLVERQEFTEGVRSLLDVLPERQGRIMRLRFGLEDGRERTLQEVAEELGLTRERIRQLEKQSLAVLKQSGQQDELFALAG
ncbi:RNA polymerase primary sigma factor/RNA polymerase nonessential primary-like sigma factor [Lentzea xinjiangensis]|uniref:RNA polymerase sigma factor n=1 Tax=Lentzea xinjiangensis TaxID=402600 RepID=A0A1H9VUB9_9PSEU|nr:sigma-70 family RNA polymerase sigma factor [Lentzea xinjiangensis]SES25192.1 RNA polymerase primary sigma factor/RNA polymerase nonessential primary-like sigma factor [Lentzea xinjiangensis]